MASTEFYAWSDLYHGGKTEKRERAGGQSMTVVLERNIVPRGEKVTQAQLGCKKEEWQTLVDGGSVRPYPLPEGADTYISPTNAIMSGLVNEQGDVDTNRLLELGLAHPPVINPPAAEDTPTGV